MKNSITKTIAIIFSLIIHSSLIYPVKFHRIFITILLTLILFNGVIDQSNAQVPQKINFQAIARNSDGQILAEQQVGIRLTIIDSASGGTEIYQEVHSLQTNAYGSFSIQINDPLFVINLPNSVQFENIPWITGNKYIKIDFDTTVALTFPITLGTIPLTSVPFAFVADEVSSISSDGAVNGSVLKWNETTNRWEPGTDSIDDADADITNELQNLSINGDTLYISNGNNVVLPSQTSSGVPLYTQQQIDSLTPVAGMIVFNTDYKILQVYDGSQWVGNQSSGCVPQANNADAGTDQLGLTSTTTTLQGNEPSFGVNGKWTVVNGTGGSFTDDTNPATTFTGTNNTAYILRWSLMTVCDTTTDEVNISFSIVPSIYFNGTLYVHPYDNSTGAYWSEYGTDIISGNGAESDTNGLANTTAIVTDLGDNGGTEYAAKICDTLTSYGYSDWYLPAKAELNVLYENKDAIGGFSSNHYWSSTEGGSYNAWGQDFDYGDQDHFDKVAPIYVRCVRRD